VADTAYGAAPMLNWLVQTKGIAPVTLANDPRLLLMDEPTAGMAPRERNDLISLIRRLVVVQASGTHSFKRHHAVTPSAYRDRIR
jgi:branched-chain amino acid transport system ATP-binding protein